ncbi:helix-turn-helix transcriptional regulator [Chryseobacterium camelliae]|uniref:Helix-turn-helix transcriptional regulator n=1 Tax=Chryseobacterium camelliae TaxID=1265445 RepID=A0ABY7QNI9_9FLAO|nr:helix-turn-helix transcriptional regulator [Chryseobacterium camelliae]WBV61247.1 helix-turn-helix transcriptional regulator [Chryseobacterium camelliae]
METNIPAPKLPDDSVAYKQIKGVDDYNKTIKCTYFLVVLFTEGSGIHYIDDAEFPIAKNQLHFLFPGQHHHWVTGPETFAHKVVVGKKIFETFSSSDEFHFIKHNLNPVFKLSNNIFQSVNTEMESIKRDLEVFEEDMSWKKIIQVRMDLLASMMKREAEAYIKNDLLAKSNPVIKKFWDLVNQHYFEHKIPKWYADRLAVTPNYLNILCKRNLNITASDLIHQRIMQEAKNQLRFSEKSVKEITADLGFQNVSGFSAFFKKKSSFSPTEYRGS